MEIVMNTAKESQSMKKQLADLLVAISWADLSRTYFGKSSSWLYHKMDGSHFKRKRLICSNTTLTRMT